MITAPQIGSDEERQVCFLYLFLTFPHFQCVMRLSVVSFPYSAAQIKFEVFAM